MNRLTLSPTQMLVLSFHDNTLPKVRCCTSFWSPPFEILRNKIAHNNLFTASDLETGERLAAEISGILSEANSEAERLVITNEEREAIKEQVIAKASSWQGDEISEDRFLSELKETEISFLNRGKSFVGLTHFLNDLLIPNGFSYLSCQAMIEKLSKNKQIEVYYVPHPADPEKKTAAIRLPKP